MFDSFRKRQNRKRLEAALQKMKPYVFSPRYDALWFHWEILPTMEELGVLPRHDGLPVAMTKEECLAVNGGVLPRYWGEMPYAWRSEQQRESYYRTRPELFNRKQ